MVGRAWQGVAAAGRNTPWQPARYHITRVLACTFHSLFFSNMPLAACPLSYYARACLHLSFLPAPRAHCLASASADVLPLLMRFIKLAAGAWAEMLFDSASGFVDLTGNATNEGAQVRRGMDVIEDVTAGTALMAGAAAIAPRQGIGTDLACVLPHHMSHASSPLPPPLFNSILCRSASAT